MKHLQFGLNNAKTKCWRRYCTFTMCHVKKLTFKLAAFQSSVTHAEQVEQPLQVSERVTLEMLLARIPLPS